MANGRRGYVSPSRSVNFGNNIRHALTPCPTATKARAITIMLGVFDDNTVSVITVSQFVTQARSIRVVLSRFATNDAETGHGTWIRVTLTLLSARSLRTRRACSSSVQLSPLARSLYACVSNDVHEKRSRVYHVFPRKSTPDNSFNATFSLPDPSEFSTVPRNTRYRAKTSP